MERYPLSMWGLSRTLWPGPSAKFWGSWVCGHWYRDWLCEGSGTGAGYEPRTARDHLGPGVLGAYLVLVWVGSLASQKLVVLVQAWCWGPRSEVKWKVFPL